MKNNLLFDFIVNKENNTIHIKREFTADLELIWKAWTTAELLDKWWAPAPLRNQTKHLSFCEGGYWLYTMLDENGERIKLNRKVVHCVEGTLCKVHAKIVSERDLRKQGKKVVYSINEIDSGG